ncbi:MAG: spore coat protein GerQ [Bacilli bacterium]|nr:spore coat protein GerQ [Bacilli bacterium]
MNNNYLNNNSNFPGTPIYSGNIATPNQSMTNTSMNEYIPDEQSYIENILRVNKGKRVSVYQSFADAGEWKDRIFTGIIEQSGRDHIILSDPNTGNWYLLLMIYVNFIKFDEEINTVEQFYPQKG